MNKNELEIKANYSVGTVSWNFDEIKTMLAERLEIFKNSQYDETMVKDAKTDLAYLRKLKTSIDERRKEIKAEMLKPYDLIESQAKELNGLIDDSISSIKTQVDEFERKRKDEKREECLRIFSIMIQECGFEEYAGNIIKTYFNPKWENKSTPIKTVNAEVVYILECIRKDLEVIKSCVTGDEYNIDEFISFYFDCFDVSEVLEEKERVDKLLNSEPKIILVDNDTGEIYEAETNDNERAAETEVNVDGGLIRKTYTIEATEEQHLMIADYIEFILSAGKAF